jgi:hypothetical protein
MPPILHESNERWIYESLCNNKFKYNEELQMYKYSNSQHPTKNYKKTFNPAEFMKRGDVINFGGSYRNENKMIFDGQKLLQLYTKIDDYGSVPPNFVCGDLPDEFNIGDFENLIDHNSISWLSKDILKKIELDKKDNDIYGKVSIKGKIWNIYFELSSLNTEFDTNWGGSKNFNCNIDNDIIVKSRNNYLIKTEDPMMNDNLKTLIKENNNSINIIYTYNSSPDSSGWFAYKNIKETKLTDFTDTPIFPLILKKNDKNYRLEVNICKKARYDHYLDLWKKDLNNVYVIEITGYLINITLQKISHNLQGTINKLIDNYDNINERRPFHREGINLLVMYI